MLMTCFLTTNFMLDTAQTNQNLASKIKNHFINEDISIKNYHDKRYTTFLDKKELKSIPLKLGESLNADSLSQNLLGTNAFKLNNLKLINDYEFQMVGNDPFLVLEFNHLVKRNDLIKLKINNGRNNGSGQLFWNSGSGFSEEESVTFNITNGVKSYVIPMGMNTKWINSKNIVELRLDFDIFKGEDTIKISDFVFINEK